MPDWLKLQPAEYCPALWLPVCSSVSCKWPHWPSHPAPTQQPVYSVKQQQNSAPMGASTCWHGRKRDCRQTGKGSSKTPSTPPLHLIQRSQDPPETVCLFVGCLTSRLVYLRDGSAQTIFTCCHTEIEVADQTFYLTQSQYTDTGPTSPSADPTTPGAWQGSHWSANSWVTGMTQPRKNPGASGIRTRDLPLSQRTPYH